MSLTVDLGTHILTKVGLECSDFLNLNELLLDLNLTPEALRIPIPRYLYEERADAIESRITNLASHKAKQFPSAKITFPVLSLREAISVIQKAERGRQGKLRAKYMRELRLEAKRDRLLLSDVEGGESEVDLAVQLIQRVYRGFRARNLVQMMREEDMIFLGMACPKIVDKAGSNRTLRKVVQAEYADDYVQGLIATKDKIMRMVCSYLMVGRTGYQRELPRRLSTMVHGA